MVLADINYPTHTICTGNDRPKEYRADGVTIPDLLDAILTLMPLDAYVENPVQLMDLTDSDKEKGFQVPIWEEYRKICDKHESSPVNFEKLERFKFYEKSKKVYAIIHTGETAAYANILLKRGVC